MTMVPRTKAELDALFPAPTQPAPQPAAFERRALSFEEHRDAKDRAEMPGADEMTETQVVAAIQRVHEDSRDYPKFPWPALDDLSGPMCPEDLVIVAARTGGGKSLFLQNVFDAMIVAGRFGLYVGLEQTPEILRIKWACLRVGVAPKLVLAPGEMHGTKMWEDAMTRVQHDLHVWQKSPDIRVRAHFATARRIDARGLKRWTEWAVDQGCEFVMVDHIDRIRHGDGRNSFHEMSETVRLAKELAVEHRITMLVASQVGRPSDSLEQFIPPSLHALRGGGTKEEEADTVLGIYRPLRPTVTEGELKQVRQGLRDRDTVIEPNVMGVMLLKHRLDGPVAGKMVKLAVHHQRVLNLRDVEYRRDQHEQPEWHR